MRAARRYCWWIALEVLAHPSLLRYDVWQVEDGGVQGCAKVVQWSGQVLQGALALCAEYHTSSRGLLRQQLSVCGLLLQDAFIGFEECY